MLCYEDTLCANNFDFNSLSLFFFCDIFIIYFHASSAIVLIRSLLYYYQVIYIETGRGKYSADRVQESYKYMIIIIN